jgi:hypothetical protein
MKARTAGVLRLRYQLSIAFMTPTTSFYLGLSVQLLVGAGQVGAAIFFIYRWQRESWQFSNLMKIREPLARAYCSLSAVVRARVRLVEDGAESTKAAHDREAISKFLTATQDEIVNFSVEHFKAKFWLSDAENQQLDVLFDKLREEWRAVRNDVQNPQDRLDELRQEILKFDAICGLKKHHVGKWSHVALHE